MRFGFIVDTDSYTGNFEREMCAFMTGHIGKCEKGFKEKLLYKKTEKLPISSVVPFYEDGYPRIVRIFTTPNVWNNGLGFHFKDGEEKQALEAYKNYVTEDKKRQILLVEGHRGKNIPSWTDEAIDLAISRYRMDVANVLLKESVEKYPAYQSIFINFSSLPDKETISFLKERAVEYSTLCEYGFSITGFRIMDNGVEMDNI